MFSYIITENRNSQDFNRGEYQI